LTNRKYWPFGSSTILKGCCRYPITAESPNPIPAQRTLLASVTSTSMHLTHHRNEFLTDPLEDPESYYLTAENWAACGTLRRTLYWAHNTCLGRLLLGPFRSLWSLLRHEAARIARRDTALFKDWAVHFVGAGLVLCWVCIVCGIPFWEYLLFFVYPGLSLTLLRSFVEHQARVNVSERSIIVEAGPFFSLLYLNNNLHLVHHRIPGLP